MGSISNNAEYSPSGDTTNGAVTTVNHEYVVPDVLLGAKRRLKVIYMGMGMSGIDFAYHMQNKPEIDLQIYERNSEPGGTWLENTYPGCACDVPVAIYQFPWALKTDWPHYYAFQPDILKYMQDVVVQHDLSRFVEYKHTITAADWLEEQGKWRLTIMVDNDPDKLIHDEADFIINGTGILNNWKWPKIEGLHDFKGPMTHSARWNKDIDMQDKRVAVIGVGSSAVQVVPAIIDKTKETFVFNRSKTWITPGFASKFSGPDGTNKEYSEKLKKRFATDPKDYMNYVKTVEHELGGVWKMFLRDTPEMIGANAYAKNVMSEKLQHRQDLIDAIVPTTFALGCRRPTPGTGFLEALVKPNTTLVTGGIASIDATGINRPNGEHIDVDVIVCCTGFDTSFRPRFPIMVRGVNMQDDIGAVENKQSYLGLAHPGVPNYFVSFGAYAPYIQGSASQGIQIQTLYFLKVIEKAQMEFIKEISPRKDATADFIKHANTFAHRGPWNGPCPSWYKGGNINGDPVVWPGSRVHSLVAIENPRYEDYEIKYIHGNRFAYLGNGFTTIEEEKRDTTFYYGLLDGKDEIPAWEE